MQDGLWEKLAQAVYDTSKGDEYIPALAELFREYCVPGNDEFEEESIVASVRGFEYGDGHYAFL
jgi:hypothetical protein